MSILYKYIIINYRYTYHYLVFSVIRKLSHFMSLYPSPVPPRKPIQDAFSSSRVTKRGLKELAQQLRMDVQVALRVAHLMLGLKGISFSQPRRNDEKLKSCNELWWNHVEDILSIYRCIYIYSLYILYIRTLLYIHTCTSNVWRKYRGFTSAVCGCLFSPVSTAVVFLYHRASQ